MKRFCGDIWRVGKEDNQEAEWLKNLKNELGNNKHFRERLQ